VRKGPGSPTPASINSGKREMSVYFIKAGGLIKIGFTRNLSARLLSLQTGNGHQLEQLAVVDGSIRDEGDLRMILAQFRVRGEWFKDCMEVRLVIQAAEGGGIGSAMACARELARARATQNVKQMERRVERFYSRIVRNASALGLRKDALG
jgi:hypothetical protein